MELPFRSDSFVNLSVVVSTPIILIVNLDKTIHQWIPEIELKLIVFTTL